MLYSIELRSQRAAKIINNCFTTVTSAIFILNIILDDNSLANCNKICQMKIYFWSVGKAHEPYLKEGVELFTKRVSHYYPVEWRIFAPAKNAAVLTQDQMKAAESSLLLAALQTEDTLVVLDENGKQWSSPQLANFIEQKANESSKNIIFLIGGAYGLHENVLKKCAYRWSLSKLVFPHQIVRLILAEQIYRACTIIRNEKYHHS